MPVQVLTIKLVGITADDYLTCAGPRSARIAAARGRSRVPLRPQPNASALSVDLPVSEPSWPA